MKPKEIILNRLNRDGGVVSGEALSAELDVSRVSIWKHIKGMVQSGIPVVSTPMGYRLERDPDHLLPWTFASRESLVHFFEETTSTMDEATALARKGCPAFTLALAQRQTHGRGRMTRTWLSTEGGLYFTVVLRPEIPLALSGLVNMAAAIDMAAVLQTSYRIDACVKWPNDILVGDRKICGILSQMEVEGDQVAYMNIGIGLNVNNSPEIEEPMAVSMKTLLEKSVPRRKILETFLDLFEKRMVDFHPAGIIEQWRKRNSTIGRKVRIVTLREEVQGTALDIDNQGGLIVSMDDGTQQTVMYGDCFHHT